MQQNEDLRRKERTSNAMVESYRKDVDVLKFQMGLDSEEEEKTHNGKHFITIRSVDLTYFFIVEREGRGWEGGKGWK